MDLITHFTKKLARAFLQPGRVYFSHDGNVYADYPFTEAEQMVRSGKIPLTDHFWHEGLDEWMLVSESNALKDMPSPPK